MYRWIVDCRVRRSFRQLNERNLSPAVQAFAPGSVLEFPGNHDLSGDYRGPEGAERFFLRLFERFPDLRFHIDDVVVSGPPWNMRICTRYHDETSSSTQTFHGIQYAKVRWGRMTLDRIYNDTQAVATYLAGRAQ